MTATEKAGRLPVPVPPPVFVAADRSPAGAAVGRPLAPTLMFIAPGGSAAGGGLSEAHDSSGPRRLLTRVGEEASRDRG